MAKRNIPADRNSPGTISSQGLDNWQLGDNLIAVTDVGEIQPGQSIIIDALDNDIGDGLSIIAASVRPGGSGGSVSFTATTVTFDTGTDFDGLADGECEVVTIDYTIQDSNLDTDDGAILVTVCNPVEVWIDQDELIIIDQDGFFILPE